MFVLFHWIINLFGSCSDNSSFCESKIICDNPMTSLVLFRIWKQSIIITYFKLIMVLLHYKKSDHNQFLYEKHGSTLIAEIVTELVESTQFFILSEQYANTDWSVCMRNRGLGYSWRSKAGINQRTDRAGTHRQCIDNLFGWKEEMGTQQTANWRLKAERWSYPLSNRGDKKSESNRYDD